MSFPWFNQFCWVLLFINIHIFHYPDPQLSGLFDVVPERPDNRGSTVIGWQGINNIKAIYIGWTVWSLKDQFLKIQRIFYYKENNITQ